MTKELGGLPVASQGAPLAVEQKADLEATRHHGPIILRMLLLSSPAGVSTVG